MEKYSFLTTYTKDYTEKSIQRVQPKARTQEFPDPVSEGFREYLILDPPELIPPNEDGELYLDKFKEKYKDLTRIHFETPINKEVIYTNAVTHGLVSEYQVNYCDIVKDKAFYLAQRGKKVELPGDIYVPLTTYTSAFREPMKLCPSLKEKTSIIAPRGDLGVMDRRLNELLGNKLGESEYSDNIGKLGGRLVRGHMAI